MRLLNISTFYSCNVEMNEECKMVNDEVCNNEIKMECANVNKEVCTTIKEEVIIMIMRVIFVRQ